MHIIFLVCTVYKNIKKVSIVGAFFISSGKLFQTRQPEYLKLCLKHSVLGFGGIKQPAEDDLKFILVFKLFRGQIKGLISNMWLILCYTVQLVITKLCTEFQDHRPSCD